MFERLEPITPDSILALLAAYRADPAPAKVDLGIGVYRDARGETPVLEAVRAAEAALLASQTTKAYVGPTGNAGFNAAMEQLVFGAGHPLAGSGRLRTLQAVGGCGALRLGAEIIRLAAPQAVVHVPTPTWANHAPLLGNAGLKLESYPYFDASTGGVNSGAMLGALERLPAGAVVVLHASCHNPTGADLSQGEWRAVLEVVKRRSLLPFIDMAYQGLGEGLDADAYAVRLFAGELPELLCAVSCSKNFGLYRERTGALHVVASTAAAAEASLSNIVKLARGMWSMPPDHGAAVVHGVLGDARLRSTWEAELTGMRTRIGALREALVRALREHYPRRDFGFIARQRGMFSYLGISTAQVRELRARHHIYMTDDSRMNVAGLREDGIEFFARAVAEVLGQ